MLICLKLKVRLKKISVILKRVYEKILLNMAHTLRSHSVYIDEEQTFQDLEKRLKEANDRARQHLDNYIMHEVKYYVEYMEMRTTQFTILEHMRKHIVKFENDANSNRNCSKFCRENCFRTP